MLCLKPKPVLGQARVAICLLLVLVVLGPGIAGGAGQPPDPPHPSLIGNRANRGMDETSSASIKIDTDSQYVGQVGEVPILIKNAVVIGGFELEVDFNHQDLNFEGAVRGEALSDTSNGHYNWEEFAYRLLPYTDTLYRCALAGLYDLPGQPPGVPLAPHPDYVSLIILKFSINNSGFASGTFLPIKFEWEGQVVNDTLVTDPDCLENTLTDTAGDTLYASQNPAQFNPFICSEGGPFSTSLEFLDGGVYAFHDSNMTGDVNLNEVAYDAGDWMLFQRFLLYGDSILIDPELQALNSDVNCDYLPWTIADLLYMCRVMLHDADPRPCKNQGLASAGDTAYRWATTDELVLVPTSAHPGDVVSVPVWLSNSKNVSGTTFKIVFDSSLLSVEGVDTSQTRIETWAEIHPVINPSGLFFFAYPDWWTIPRSISCIRSGEGVLININFKVNADAPSGTSIPITFETEPNEGHYNSYTDTTGLTLVQPSTIPGRIFTNVISGDANSDGMVDVADVVYLVNYLFRRGVPPNPLSLGDFAHDGQVDVADVVGLVNFLFGR
jgi:hypothetical protein